MNTSTYFVITISLIYAMKLIITFGIKIYQKLPIFLTIQKLDFVNRLSVASFASSIKPPPFTGSNYNSWHEGAILWFTAMRMMYVTKGKPSQYTPGGGECFRS